MARSLPFPRDDAPLQKNTVIELPFLLDGRRVFVATDHRGWMVARGLASSEREAQRVVDSLWEAIDERDEPPGPRLMP